MCLSECPHGYFSNNNHTCDICDLSCSTCRGNAKNCTSCFSHQYVDGGLCSECARNCTECVGTMNNCSNCEDSYILSNYSKIYLCFLPAVAQLSLTTTIQDIGSYVTIHLTYNYDLSDIEESELSKAIKITIRNMKTVPKLVWLDPK